MLNPLDQYCKENCLRYEQKTNEKFSAITRERLLKLCEDCQAQKFFKYIKRREYLIFEGMLRD